MRADFNPEKVNVKRHVDVHVEASSTEEDSGDSDFEDDSARRKSRKRRRRRQRNTGKSPGKSRGSYGAARKQVGLSTSKETLDPAKVFDKPIVLLASGFALRSR